MMLRWDTIQWREPAILGSVSATAACTTVVAALATHRDQVS